MNELVEDDYKQMMLEDLDLGETYNVPVWLATMIDILIDRGWKKEPPHD